MITLLLQLLRLLPFLCGGHRQLALENLALHQQLTVYKRTVPRPKLRTTDRLFWVALARVWAGWRQPLVIVTPDTILRWQRRRFREHWTKLSGRPTRGRPPVNPEIAALVTRMTAANPLWGAPRIHGELLKLGFHVAERTVSRLIPKRRTPPSQTWLTFWSSAKATCAASWSATSPTITGLARISRSTRMRRTSGPSSSSRRAGSWRFPKSVACITATSARRRSLAPAVLTTIEHASQVQLSRRPARSLSCIATPVWPCKADGLDSMTSAR